MFFIEERSILISDWRDNKGQTAQDLAVFLKRDAKVRVLQEYRRQGYIYEYLHIFEYSGISTDEEFFRRLNELGEKTGLAPQSIVLPPHQMNGLFVSLGDPCKTGCHATLKWVQGAWNVNVQHINCFLLNRGAERIEGNALAAVIYGPESRQYFHYEYSSTCIEATPTNYADLSEILWNWDGQSDINAFAESKRKVVKKMPDSEKWYKIATLGYMHHRMEVSTICFKKTSR
jgi:hypothetical protein